RIGRDVLLEDLVGDVREQLLAVGADRRRHDGAEVDDPVGRGVGSLLGGGLLRRRLGGGRVCRLRSGLLRRRLGGGGLRRGGRLLGRRLLRRRRGRGALARGGDGAEARRVDLD